RRRRLEARRGRAGALLARRRRRRNDLLRERRGEAHRAARRRRRPRRARARRSDLGGPADRRRADRGRLRRRERLPPRRAAALAWTFPPRDFVYGSAVAAAEDVLVGSWDGGLYRLRLADGHPLWRYGGRWDFESSPALARDGETIYLGSRDRKLHAVSAA